MKQLYWTLWREKEVILTYVKHIYWNAREKVVLFLRKHDIYIG